MLEIAFELWAVARQYMIGKSVHVSLGRSEGIGERLGRRGTQWDREGELFKPFCDKQNELMVSIGLM